MAVDPVQAVRDALVADSGVTGQLSTYVFTTGEAAEPAVFTVDPIPTDASLPALVVTQPGGSDWGTLDKRGAEVDVHVRGWFDKEHGRSTAAMWQLAWDVRELLDWVTLDIDGYGHWGCFATAPPGAIEDPDGFPGFLVPLMVRILED